MEKKLILQLLHDFSEQYGDTYEYRCIYDSSFDEFADKIINAYDSKVNKNPPVRTFVCEDCGGEMPINKKCDSDIEVCDDCIRDYDNKTGYCSVHCRYSGQCDQSC
ncbi:hypothetical protein LL912_00665 [Niabella sp. CC-SYL272]|uniref:hypothetical protein n=1 Tax=Niabella agricola TaxID=2891571 RepID=UPI001F208509|nr:hypothetical protein [Niabella agricola]MCF3107278.1 hypothetical protein [Niabella agricola]